MSVLLLDGHNLLFRSFTSLPRSITGANDEPINGIYGMLGVILRLAREHKPSHIVAAFDVPDVPTFRHALFPSYQAQRGPLGGEHADEFRHQIEMAQTVLPAIGVPALTRPEYEADDIMGTLATQIAQEGGQATIVSTDRDLLQLVGPGIDVLVPGATSLHVRTSAGVQERIGVPPSGVTTYKALAGDASDNIPGVPGIGSKTAVRLVDEYASLENIFENLEVLPARTATLLRTNRDQAFLFRRIVTVVTDLELPIDIRDLPLLAVDENSRARTILDELGFGRS